MALGKASFSVPNSRCKFREDLVQSRTSGEALDQLPEEGGREPRTQAKLKPKLVSDAHIHNLPGSRGRGQGRAGGGTGSTGLT